MEPPQSPHETAPKAMSPVMDVITPPKPTPATSPTPAVVPVPVADQPAQPKDETVPPEAIPKPTKPAPKPTKQSNVPVLAIALALIIFALLSGLSFYAYLQSK